MPLYLFRCSASDGDHSNTWGMSLEDDDAALAMAMVEARSLGDSLRDAPGTRTYRFEIEDETGRPLMAVPL